MMDGAKKARDFLKRHSVGVLSTASPDGEPWGATIHYAVDDEFRFYFMTRAQTRKYRNLKDNPRAALTVTDPESQTTVQASGKIAEVPPEEYMDIVFNKLSKSSLKPKGEAHWTPPMDKLRAGDYMPLCLTPDNLQYADYGQAKDAGADYIERIIP